MHPQAVLIVTNTEEEAEQVDPYLEPEDANHMEQT